MRPTWGAAVLAAVAMLAVGAQPAAARPDDVAGWCFDGTCGLEASTATDDYGPVPDVAGHADVEPTEHSPLLDSLVAAVYEETGFTRCPFEGLRRDDEAGLAPADIVRACDEEAEEGDDDAPPSWDEIVALINREYLTLPIEASAISHQPDGDWALINVDFIVMTDPTPQVFERDLLGMSITFRATPVHYLWDFGDGSPPLETSSPGRPYPDQDVTHVYTSAADGVEVSLTTTWEGSFQINGGGTWLPVSGFATTTAVAPPVEIVAMDTRLVPNP